MNPAFALDIFIQLDNCQSFPVNLDLSVGPLWKWDFEGLCGLNPLVNSSCPLLDLILVLALSSVCVISMDQNREVNPRKVLLFLHTEPLSYHILLL